MSFGFLRTGSTVAVRAPVSNISYVEAYQNGRVVGTAALAVWPGKARQLPVVTATLDLL